MGRGDLNEIDYWWRYWAENPMVMGLSSWQTLVVGSGDSAGVRAWEGDVKPFVDKGKLISKFN
jgi:hypothetical protein